MVVTVKDMMCLRTRLAFLNSEAAKTVAPRVAEIMQTALGWSKSERNRQLKEAEEYLAQFGGPTMSKDAIYSAATITDIQDMFKTFDQKQTGYIDFDEMMLMTKKLGFPMNKMQAEKQFKSMDLDGNNKITEKEFITWWHEAGPDDELRKNLGNKFQGNIEKLGTGSDSRGIMFG